VLGKAFAVLEAVAASSEPIGASELARVTGLPKSTVFRMARELVSLGALHTGRRGYWIGLGLFELGNQHYPSDVREAVQPYMADLCRATGLTVQAGLLDGSDVAYLDRHVPKGGGTTRRQTELRVPAYCTAAGKVLLAAMSARKLAAMIGTEHEPIGFQPADDRVQNPPRPERLRAQLEQTRRDGHAFEFGEVETGLASIAVPLPVPGSKAVHSALEVRGPMDKLRPEHVLSAARITASAVSRAAARAEAGPRSRPS
jgi:DNA-binding IclR family transcriptional regulator